MFLILLAFTELLTPSYATVIERLEAAVNNQVVFMSDLNRFRKTIPLRTQLDPLFNGSPLAKDGEKANEKAILEFLIDEKIILQQFPMTDAEVETEIGSIQANNHISREQLKQAIAAQGFPFDEYFSLIRVGAAKRNLIDREIRTKVSITKEDIQNYYYNTYAKGKPAPLAYQIQIITQKNKTRITSALNELRSGTPFAEVAKRFSDDETASTGGELGTLSEDQMNKMIRTEIKKLKVGETSGVLEDSKAKFFILRLADAKAVDDKQIELASDSIRTQLAAGEYQRQLQLWLERQRQTTYLRHAGDAPIVGLPKGP